MKFANQEVKVYSGEHGYFIRLARTNASQEWENAFFYVKFKKGISLENKSNINVKDAWLTFYKTQDKKTVWYIFINEFELLGVDSKEDTKEVVNQDQEIIIPDMN